MIKATCCCGGVPDHPNPDCERCRLVWIVNRTEEMRAAQKRFFKGRKQVDLEESRRLERLVDQGLGRVGGNQQSLF